MVPNILSTARDCLAAAIRPRSFFTTWKSPGLWQILLVSGALAFGLGLLLFLSGLVAEETLQLSQRRLQENLSPSAVATVFRNPSPASRLMFPLYWSGYLFIVTFWRQMALVLLAEPETDWRRTLAVGAIALCPLMVIAALQGVLNNFFPVMLPAPMPGLIARVGLSLLLPAVGFAWEGYICIGAFRSAGQSGGRAVFTWLFPFFALIIFASFMIYLF